MPPARSWRKYPQTYRLEAARCKKCGQTSFPPRLICPECKGRAFMRDYSEKGDLAPRDIVARSMEIGRAHV